MCVHSLNYRTGQNGLAVGNENQVPKGRTKKSSPEGTNQLSPARQRWVGKPSIASPGGTTHVGGVEDQPMRYCFCLRQTPFSLKSCSSKRPNDTGAAGQGFAWQESYGVQRERLATRRRKRSCDYVEYLEIN